MIRPLTSAAIAVVLLLGGQTAQAAGDPVTCQGYPEPRIYLENQSWWGPQPGPPEHPGTGKTGHIHVGFCAPLYQIISGSTLHLDITIKLHDLPAMPSKIRVALYNDAAWNTGIVVPLCAVSDCTYAYALDVPLGMANFGGWHELAVYLNVTNANGEVQRNWQRWPVFLDNGKPPLPNAPGNPGGDTWYSTVPGGTSGQYARANILRADVPWNEQTGDLLPVSGTWEPTVSYEANENFAYVDPAFHAVPPSKGTIIYEQNDPGHGYFTRQLRIDTTQLVDGLHRLVIGTGNVGTNGTNTGVLVVPFFVENGC